ncbi:MAG: BLUF domain-containing protein [Candidatus Hydrogenedentes bacterium]|nr:BLUF domain-containing protein [Candidatus Hydrogenedentota bacterium]
METKDHDKLVRLIYVSVMTKECDAKELEDIETASRIKNEKQGITGALCHGPSFFLQCLEGPRDTINTLYTYISGDQRHQYLTILEYVDIENRLFADWIMGSLSNNKLDRKLLEKHTPGGVKFDPYLLDGRQVRNFLLDFVKVKGESKEKSQLVRLIYVSAMTEECDIESLEKILTISRARNTKQGITGILCYDPSFFLQCLEGPRDAVNTLYSHISRDSRHQYLTLLEYTEIESRLFGDWTMGFMSRNVLDKKILDKYAPTSGKFDPFILNGKQVREFLLDIIELKHEHLID